MRRPRRGTAIDDRARAASRPYCSARKNGEEQGEDVLAARRRRRRRCMSRRTVRTAHVVRHASPNDCGSSSVQRRLLVGARAPCAPCSRGPAPAARTSATTPITTSGDAEDDERRRANPSSMTRSPPSDRRRAGARLLGSDAEEREHLAPDLAAGSSRPAARTAGTLDADVGGRRRSPRGVAMPAKLVPRPVTIENTPETIVPMPTNGTRRWRSAYQPGEDARRRPRPCPTMIRMPMMSPTSMSRSRAMSGPARLNAWRVEALEERDRRRGRAAA